LAAFATIGTVRRRSAWSRIQATAAATIGSSIASTSVERRAITRSGAMATRLPAMASPARADCTSQAAA
jgi:stage V sporulation protein SpoVS